MRHIERNSCGYAGTDGYTCVGAPSLTAMFIGNGLTCDSQYDRGANDQWVADVDPAIPMAKLESFLTSGVDQVLYDLKHATSSDVINWKINTYHSMVHSYLYYDTDTSPEANFGRAMAEWLMIKCTGYGDPSMDPYAVSGINQASIKPTLDTAYAYMSEHIDVIEQGGGHAETVAYYANIYMHSGTYMDNYLNLPAKFREQVTAWSPVPDMSTQYSTGIGHSALIAPETECRNNFDAMTVDGFLDLFHVVYANRTLEPSSAAYNTAHSKIIARESGSLNYTDLIAGLICFNDNMFEPGFMEPPLPVKHVVPPWPVVSQLDSAVDGAMLSVANLTAWKNIVNLWINDIGRSLMHIWGLRSLLVQIMRNQINKDSNIFDFTISTSSDNVLKWTTESGTHSNPSFSVKGGTMYINGQSKSVSGTTISSSQVPVHIWLNVSLSDCDSDTGQYGTVSASLGTSAASGNDKFAISIGGIRKIEVNASNGVPGYTLYQILQERHFVSIELVRVCKEGILYRFTSGASPYRVLATAPCPTQPQS